MLNVKTNHLIHNPIVIVLLLYCYHYLYRIVLYLIVLYCIVLYCIVLYCIVLYRIVLYRIAIISYCIVSYHIVLYRYCIVSYCIIKAIGWFSSWTFFFTTSIATTTMGAQQIRRNIDEIRKWLQQINSRWEAFFKGVTFW